MAHEFESGMFVGEEAWHGLGTVLEDPPTVEEGIKTAGLDWTVLEKDIGWYTFGEPGTNEINSHKALVRDSDNSVLGVVGSSYKPLQNREAFAFFNPFLDQQDATLETAGALREGRTVFVLAKLKGSEAEVLPGDPVNGYLLLYNSHDGTLAVGVQFTSVRVVCQNTLTFAINRGGRQDEACVKIRHTRGLKEALGAVQRAINIAGATFSASVEAYQELARKKLPVKGLENYVREVLEFEDAEKTPKALAQIEERYYTGPGYDIPGVSGTYWGAFNAVTDWLDHHRGRSADSSLWSSWFGESKKIRQRAMDTALAA